MKKLIKIIPVIIVTLCVMLIVTITLKQANNSIINRVNPEKIIAGQRFNESEGVSTMGVYGKKFQPGDIIYINNVAQDTTFGNEGWLTCFVPDDFYKKHGRMKIQVKRLNEKGKVINQSNVFIRRVEKDK